MDDMVKIFKALADKTRLKILIILSKRKICAKGIARHLDISEAAVSQHLKILKEAKIITGEKKGYYVHYNTQDQVFKQIIEFIQQISNYENSYNLEVEMPDVCKETCKRKHNTCLGKTNRNGDCHNE